MGNDKEHMVEMVALHQQSWYMNQDSSNIITGAAAVLLAVVTVESIVIVVIITSIDMSVSPNRGP